MILASVTIRDYKQFAGEHRFEPDRQGITAVIGPNGAGKTTLFEAIEWCLYGPRSIASTDVLPRGVGGAPMVRVVFEEPRTGQRHVVERRLTRGKTMQAEIWDETNPEEMLATGSIPVKKFVGEKLIGLGHAAFIATFFTRQKELSFFGSLGVTERRRKVGQMIGVETVRIAQAAIGEERAQVAANANALGVLAEQETDERDLGAEIKQATAKVNEAAEMAARRSVESADARSALIAANEAAERERTRADQDQILGTAIAQLTADRRGLESRLEGIDRELERLAGEESRRESLEPLASRADERRNEVERWAREEKRAAEIAERRRSLAIIEQDRRKAVTSAERLAQASATPHLSEWTWTAATGADREIARLLAVSSAIDLESDRKRLTAMESLASRQSELTKASDELAKYRSRLKELREREAVLTESGDPSVAITANERAIEKTRAESARFTSERNQAQTQARTLEPLLANLAARTFDDRCPTCGRSIDEAEADEVIATLRSQIENWMTVARARERDIQQATDALKRLDAELVQVRARAEELIKVRTNIENGVSLTADKETEVERLRQLVDAANADAISTSTPADIEQLRARIDALSNVVSAGQGLTQVLTQLQGLAERESAVNADLISLGTSTYDPEVHRAATAALEEANRAKTMIEAIDRELAHRSEIVNNRAACEASLAENTSAIRDKEDARRSLGFSPADSIAMREKVDSANAADRNATSQLHMAQSAEKDARGELARIEREQRRIQEQLDRSAALRREADQLSTMYSEFGIFDQYVAARIAPRLAEQTSELLEIATDGKYTSVEFDENYGIHVYDGTTEKFPLESFSGGERDVVSLCARLALSQMIGSSGANPPSFLVLDEVFGALDRDRRVHLLELLGRISESIDAFQQMFIISHVDDVRSSPIFTRVIRISETSTGSSLIEDASANPGQED